MHILEPNSIHYKKNMILKEHDTKISTDSRINWMILDQVVVKFYITYVYECYDSFLFAQGALNLFLFIANQWVVCFIYRNEFSLPAAIPTNMSYQLFALVYYEIHSHNHKKQILKLNKLDIYDNY